MKNELHHSRFGFLNSYMKLSSYKERIKAMHKKVMCKVMHKVMSNLLAFPVRGSTSVPFRGAQAHKVREKVRK